MNKRVVRIDLTQLATGQADSVVGVKVQARIVSKSFDRRVSSFPIIATTYGYAPGGVGDITGESGLVDLELATTDQMLPQDNFRWAFYVNDSLVKTCALPAGASVNLMDL